MTPEAITAIGGIIGGMIAAITFLFKALVDSKNETIKEIEEERDYWREIALGSRVLPKHPHEEVSQ